MLRASFTLKSYAIWLMPGLLLMGLIDLLPATTKYPDGVFTLSEAIVWAVLFSVLWAITALGCLGAKQNSWDADVDKHMRDIKANAEETHIHLENVSKS